MPKSIKYEFDQKAFDAVQWFQYFRAHQQEYLRKRLRTVKLFAENHDVATIAQTLSLNKNTVYGFLKLYLREEPSIAACESLSHGRADCVLLALPYACGDVESVTLFEDRLFVGPGQQDDMSKGSFCQ